MQKSLRLFAEDMQRAEKASKSVAENVAQLGVQMDHGHRSFLDYMAKVIKLPAIFREASAALTRQNEEIKTSIVRFRDQQAAGKAMIAQIREQIRGLKQFGGDPEQIEGLKTEKKIYESLVRESKAAIALEERRLSLKHSIESVTGKHLATEYILIKTLSESIKRSGEINEALMQANSLTRVRTDLTQDIYVVQAKTGASFQNMLGAAKALTNIWPKARTDFRDTLEVIVQMEEGLGVSFDNASQLARIFQINLKTPVREVADQIAIIANNTALAADEATRFATEIGKALRLLGPGAAPGAKEVAGYVTLISGRMKDVGGDANEIVKIFNEMTKGTSQAFMLRGIAGVGTPGALGTQAGAQAAMQGIGRMIDRIVTAAPGTMAYTAQLEAAAQIMGTSTETIRLYRDMLQEANKPLDEHAKLQQRWQEQVVNANKALGRLKESFLSLLHQAILPLIPPIAWTFGFLAKIVSTLASNKAAVIAVGILLAAAVAKTIFSLGKLTAAIIQVGVASDVAAKFKSLGGVGGIGAEGGMLGSLTKIFGKPGSLLTMLKSGLFAPIASLTSPSTWGAMFRFGPLAAVATAAAAGYGLGKIIDKKWPDNWIAQAARAYAKATTEASLKANVVYTKPGERSVNSVMADIRREALTGNLAAATKIFEESKYKIAGLRTEAGAKAYVNRFIKTMAEVREQRGLTSVTASEQDTLDYDRHLIELTKKQVDNSGEYIKRVREMEQRNNARYDAARAAEERQRMLSEAEFRMVSNRYMPSKPSLATSRLQMMY